MYYHVRVEFTVGRSSKTNEKYELDLTSEDLEAKIVKPFLNKATFLCGGAIVDATKVCELHFTETSQPSAELIPFIRAERKQSNIISFESDESLVPHKGKDVTRFFLERVEQAAQEATMQEATMTDRAPQKSSNDTAAEREARRIFVVHGHDVGARAQAELLLVRWGLEPIILRDQPNSGLTVIEKIEAHSDVDYAIILLTPDDMCGTEPRARQNVVFEWGFLMARLGRRRVMCLRKGETEIPSDLHGIVRIDIGSDLKEQTEMIRRELICQGFKIR